VAYDLFETTRVVPHIAYCENRYVIAAGGEEGSDPGPLDVCGGSLATTLPPETAANQSSPSSPVSRRQSLGASRNAVTRASADGAPLPCNLARPSCRKWSFLKSTSQKRSKVAESRSRRTQ
jgi:hypothetical protein